VNAPITIDDDDIEMPLAPEGWVVDTEERAAWAADVILSHEERIERIERQHLKVMLRAQREFDRARAFFVPQLRAWAAAHPPAKGKTIHLTTGSLAFRTKPGGVRVEDEAACLEWAEDHLPEAIARSVTRKLDVKAAKTAGEKILSAATFAAFSEADVPTSQAEADDLLRTLMARATGALPPGMTRVDDEQVFEIKAPGSRGAK